MLILPCCFTARCGLQERPAPAGCLRPVGPQANFHGAAQGRYRRVVGAAFKRIFGSLADLARRNKRPPFRYAKRNSEPHKIFARLFTFAQHAERQQQHKRPHDPCGYDTKAEQPCGACRCTWVKVIKRCRSRYANTGRFPPPSFCRCPLSCRIFV